MVYKLLEDEIIYSNFNERSLLGKRLKLTTFKDFHDSGTTPSC